MPTTPVEEMPQLQAAAAVTAAWLDQGRPQDKVVKASTPMNLRAAEVVVAPMALPILRNSSLDPLAAPAAAMLARSLAKTEVRAAGSFILSQIPSLSQDLSKIRERRGKMLTRVQEQAAEDQVDPF